MPYCRSFEKISGCNAIRPDIAGIMGAFGAALIARERYNIDPKETSMLSLDEIIDLDLHHHHEPLPRLHQPLCPDHQPL